MSRSSQRRLRNVQADTTQEDAMNEASKLFDNAPSQEPDEKDLVNLIEQRERLDRQISELREQKRRAALVQVNTLIQIHGFTAADLFSTGSSSRIKIKAPPKYRDPATGQQWSGRGKPPRWYALADDKQALLITNQDSE